MNSEMAQRWQPPRLIKRRWCRWLLAIGITIYFYFALTSLTLDWTRVAQGIQHGSGFLLGFLKPDFFSRWKDIVEGFLESLTMTVVATGIGALLGIVLSLGAAKNIAPKWVYYICRGIITVSRSLQEVIVAIVFVAMVGFGPLAGMLTLCFASIGFIGKLLAEAIEEIDRNQAEAVRAVGSTWPQWINYGIQPQVMPRIIGLALYRFDINFRESAIVGIVGAGGIGATINTAFDRYEFRSVAAILLIMIVLVTLFEYLSAYIRKRTA